MPHGCALKRLEFTCDDINVVSASKRKYSCNHCGRSNLGRAVPTLFNHYMGCPKVSNKDKQNKYNSNGSLIGKEKGFSIDPKTIEMNNKNDKNKNKDIWYMFNDRNISISDYDKLCKVSRYYTTDVPYMLFYKRIDEKKMINKNTNNDKEMKDENENKENNENDSEWEKKVDEDNKTFGKELIQFA
eukprot:551901_1